MSRKNKKIEVIVTVYLALVLVIAVYSADNAFGQIKTSEYEIAVNSINELLKLGNFKERVFTLKNKKSEAIGVTFFLEGNITETIRLSSERINIEPKAEQRINITIFGDKVGAYKGKLILNGDINEEIPVSIIVSEEGMPVDAIIMEVQPLKKKFYIGEPVRIKIDIQNLLNEEPYNVTFHYSIGKFIRKSKELNASFENVTEDMIIDTSLTLIKEFDIPKETAKGEYMINVKAEYLGLTTQKGIRFSIGEKLMDYLIFGLLPLKKLILWSLSIIPIVGLFIYFKKRKEKKKRYKSDIEFSLLPKAGPRSVIIGKIAETEKTAYFDIDQLTIHTLIAGSTGGGKTVSAEVLIEEVLMKDAAVIIFDPTAQWSGFLRKCQNKKMLDLYSQFSMKKTEAKAFNGNVHQVLNARQIIDIKKFMMPGEIHVFATNKLDPKDMDILVSNTIREIFHANLSEATELKLMVIFDEVHRLLPKFGGTGQGFIQIERGAREFRKWGVGLMLISQVLTDFIGSTKANINTEIQMRTRDQGDLDRIKNKYGSYMLQSLLKSATGTGMIENSAYNRGNPFFVTFRPLLHEHARLTDEELENYNKYNEVIEDLEYQIEQLEKENIDVFDLKLELKMALDKVKSGSFNMVDIYLEGLKPRVEEAWKKMGKQPKKREIKLVEDVELQREFEEAKRAREATGEKEISSPIGAQKNKLPPLKLKAGVTVNSVTELIDSINTMEEEAAKAEKEDFAKWVEQINPSVAEAVAKAESKEDIIIALEKAQ